MEILIGLRSQGGVPVTQGSSLNKKMHRYLVSPTKVLMLGLFGLFKVIKTFFNLSKARKMTVFKYYLFKVSKMTIFVKKYKKEYMDTFPCTLFCKKGYMEMTKTIYLETLKSVLGHSIFHCLRQK